MCAWPRHTHTVGAEVKECDREDKKGKRWGGNTRWNVNGLGRWIEGKGSGVLCQTVATETESKSKWVSVSTDYITPSKKMLNVSYWKCLLSRPHVVSNEDNLRWFQLPLRWSASCTLSLEWFKPAFPSWLCFKNSKSKKQVKQSIKYTQEALESSSRPTHSLTCCNGSKTYGKLYVGLVSEKYPGSDYMQITDSHNSADSRWS